MVRLHTGQEGFRCGDPLEVFWVDNWVDLDRVWQINPERISLLCKDPEGACPVMIKLLAQAACVPILC